MTGYKEFLSCHKASKAYTLYYEIFNDLITPPLAYLKIANSKEWSFLFESASLANNFSRYSFIGLDPDLIWKYKRNKAYICQDVFAYDNGNAKQLPFIEEQTEVCQSLSDLISFNSKLHTKLPKALPTQVGGLFGFLGYNTINLIERKVPDTNPDLERVDDGIYFRPRILLIFDQLESKITLTYTIRPSSILSAKQSWNKAKLDIKKTLTKLNDNKLTLDSKIKNVVNTSNFDTNIGIKEKKPKLQKLTSKKEYIEKVEKAIRYIYSGEAIQIVLSQKFSYDFFHNDFNFYRSLRQINPSPYLFYIKFNNFSLIGSSPEIMIRLKAGELTLRPLAGSYPRGRTESEDIANEKKLLTNAKERAEHLMLLDLGRNDVGRVSKANSVYLEESFKVERYSSVMHISSTVKGEINNSKSKLSALFSGLPAGTVSGAPKVRAMEIIDELEKYRRGFYSGTLGYFDRKEDFDTCILLRSALYKKNKIYLQTGAGIVAKSKAENEYKECLLKLKAMQKALERISKFSN